MKKESIIAVVLGIIMGLVVAYSLVSYIRRRQAPAVKTPPTIEPKPKQIQTDTPSSITLLSPRDGTIVGTDVVTIKGEGKKGNLLFIQSPLAQQVLELTKDEFEVPFELAIGENVIHISMYSNDATQRAVERTIRVYYLDEQ